MNSSIAQLVFAKQRIAYALVNQDWVITEVHGDQTILWGDNAESDNIGQPLLGSALELAASEAALQAIQAGEIDELRLESVNRVDMYGNTRYVTLVVQACCAETCGMNGFLYVAQEATHHGMVAQELMQRHNELRLLQQRLERQNLELTASITELRLMNEIRSSFISVAAHELRTPLTSIYGFLELLQDAGIENLTLEQQEYLDWIEVGTQRLLTTLSELLDAARIDADRLDIVLQPTDMSDIVSDALLAAESRLTARKQHLDVDFPPNLPQALCDPDRIEQVLGHLLNNASKFTPTGGTLGLSVQPGAAGEFLHISVSDQGAGIGQEEENHLFESFYRTKKVRQEGVKGAGLGLYIARSLIELHGGEIWCESMPGQGSIFHVTIPVVATTSDLQIPTEMYSVSSP